jgi:hypothetical protein
MPMSRVQRPAHAEDRGSEVERREFGAVPPCQAEDYQPGSFRELVAAVEDHHGLHAGAAGPTCLPAHSAIAGHMRRPGVDACAASSSRR